MTVIVYVLRIFTQRPQDSNKKKIDNLLQVCHSCIDHTSTLRCIGLAKQATQPRPDPGFSCLGLLRTMKAHSTTPGSYKWLLGTSSGSHYRDAMQALSPQLSPQALDTQDFDSKQNFLEIRPTCYRNGLKEPDQRLDHST